MDIFLQQLVNSLSVASVIILIGMGITLIFGLTGIINFAHGEFLMVGGIATWVLASHGVGFWGALLAATAIVGLLGFVLERGLFRFTLERPMNGFIVSLGLVVILQHVVIRIWNSYQKSIPDPIPGVWQVGGVRIIIMRAVVVGITAAAVAISFFAISRSRYGLALRASVADQETAALMGIPVRRYVTAVFVYGSLLAGLGGALLIALFPITPFIGSVVVVRGFAVALIGGLGNVAGAVVAGLILGLVDGLSAGYGLPQWTDAYSFALMILILLVRPQGLLGGTEGPKGA
ncbi:MAG TPA: branched-chain amino acid ABC transporter permease [Acetobacteraceae bacterium]|nr:branched-chain amino acid ABC transporter permease [Acetobacteraceae bacterium]